MANQSGALAALAAKPGGIVALWVAVVALVVMGLWRLAETALGRSSDPKSQGPSSEVLDRTKSFALAVVYFAFAYSTFGFARDAPAPITMTAHPEGECKRTRSPELLARASDSYAGANTLKCVAPPINIPRTRLRRRF